jgi:hypothetical protein
MNIDDDGLNLNPIDLASLQSKSELNVSQRFQGKKMII